MTKAAETLEKKIEAQLEKLKQLKARKQAIEAREKSKQKEQERKNDTRRKILLGSYLIKKMQENEANEEKILAELNEYLTEDRDRKLFNLNPINKVFAIFQDEFRFHEEASEFLETYIQPLMTNPVLEASIVKFDGIWMIKVIADKSLSKYSELLEIFGKPIYERTSLDRFNEDIEENPDKNQLQVIEDYSDIIEVESDGYPASYDRNSLIDRD